MRLLERERTLLYYRFYGGLERKMPKKKISKEKSIRRAKLLTELIICLFIIGFGVIAIKNATDKSRKVEKTEYYEDKDIPIPDESQPVTSNDPNKIIFENETINTKAKFRGDLILVNENHQYFSGDEKLVSILEKNDEKGVDCFTAVNYDYTILDVVYEPMVKMIQGFYSEKNLNDIMIYGSYRSTEFQQQLYDADLAATGNEESTRVAKPGYSEHESGYAFDFSRYEIGSGAPVDYDGTGEYEWFTKNCYKYGFVIRYTQSKEDITKIQYEPWHFRYVGLAHSYYMTKNNICLEEYIELLRDHPYSSDSSTHLEFSDDADNAYEVYFVASDDGSEATNVPVPTGLTYDISGNNVDGFIVTIHKEKNIQESTTQSETTSYKEITE